MAVGSTPSTIPRLTQFFESFPHRATILELGPLEGGHTIENRNPEGQPHLPCHGSATAKCESTNR